jgi:hypothetical protein
VEWINKNNIPPIEKRILVFCNICKNIHSVEYSYDKYCLDEYCYESGHVCAGVNVLFDWWMPLPKPPEETK